jgi:release factor glutamine methyltransferase
LDFELMVLKMTVLELLNETTTHLRDHQIENPRLNAELLLAHSLNLSREGLYKNFHRPLKERERETLEKMVQRRVSGEPLQYILEHQEFWSIDFKVDPRVFIPRPETELLVEQSLLILRRYQTPPVKAGSKAPLPSAGLRTLSLSKCSINSEQTPACKTATAEELILSEHFLKGIPSVLEIGTGSGAIAIALAKEVRAIFLVATDISRDALVLAKENAKSAGVGYQIEFVNGDLFDPFCPSNGRKSFDLVLSNPPYVVRPGIGSLAKEVRDYEPTIALDGGKDGLEFYRHIVTGAPFYLRGGGWLLLEIGQGQSKKVAEQIERSGAFLKPQILPDLSGIERVVKAQKMESRK